MTRQDHFAAAALQGLLASGNVPFGDDSRVFADVAFVSWRFAHAMVAYEQEVQRTIRDEEDDEKRLSEPA